MKLTAICAGVACLALLTVPLKAAAQPDSPAANATTQRNLQADRVERLRKDADTLEFLAAQLYTEIGKSGPHDVSVTVTKKAEEIEKLAHKIRTESEQSR